MVGNEKIQKLTLYKACVGCKEIMELVNLCVAGIVVLVTCDFLIPPCVPCLNVCAAGSLDCLTSYECVCDRCSLAGEV